METHVLDDLDKRIITGLAKGLTVKQIARQEFKPQDDDRKAKLCYKSVQNKVDLLHHSFKCNTNAQLVIMLIHELKLVNFIKESASVDTEARTTIMKNQSNPS